MVRRVWQAKESMTSSAATSMMTPRARCRPIWSIRSLLEADELAVVEGGVDGRDEVAALPQDRDAERFLGGGVVSGRHRPS